MRDIEAILKLYHSKVDSQLYSGGYYYWCRIMGLEETLDISYPLTFTMKDSTTMGTKEGRPWRPTLSGPVWGGLNE